MYIEWNDCTHTTLRRFIAILLHEFTSAICHWALAFPFSRWFPDACSSFFLFLRHSIRYTSYTWRSTLYPRSRIPHTVGIYWDSLSATIRGRFEKKQTAGGWKYARDVSPWYNGRWYLQSPLSTTGRLLLCVTPLKSSTPPPSFLIPFCGFASSSGWRRICELNSNGSPPFRSFQRVPMFSLRLMYSRKARSLFTRVLPTSVSPFSCLDARLTQVRRGHYDFVSRQLRGSPAAALWLLRCQCNNMDNISRNEWGCSTISPLRWCYAAEQWNDQNDFTRFRERIYTTRFIIRILLFTCHFSFIFTFPVLYDTWFSEWIRYNV